MHKKHIQKYCTCTSGKHMYTVAHTVYKHTHTHTQTWTPLNISDFQHALTDRNFSHSYTHPHSLQLSPPCPRGASDPCPQNHGSFCGLPQRLPGLEHPLAVNTQKDRKPVVSHFWCTVCKAREHMVLCSLYLCPLFIKFQTTHPIQTLKINPAFPHHTHSIQDHRSLQINLHTNTNTHSFNGYYDICIVQ